MNLSQKKIKRIKLLTQEGYTVGQIARELRMSVQDVKAVQNEDNQPITLENLSWIDHITMDNIFLGLLVAYICIAPFFVINGIYDFANLPQGAFIQSGVLLLFVLWFIKQTLYRRFTISFTPFHLPLLLFLIWSIITILWALNRFEGVTTWIQWVGPFLAFVLFFFEFRRRWQCVVILNAIYVSGIAVSLFGIGQYLLDLTWVPQVVIPAATFANKNMAAHYAVMTVPLGIGFFLSSKNRFGYWYFGLTTALNITFLFYSQTRASWLSFFIECFFIFSMMLIAKKYRPHVTLGFDKQKKIALIVSCAIILVMMHLTSSGFKWTLSAPINRIINDASGLLRIQKAAPIKEIKLSDKEHMSEVVETAIEGESSFAGRYAIWRNSWEMIKEYFWFGVGLGNHKVYYPMYFRKVVIERWFSEQFQLTNAHNDYIQTWSETGTVGMIFLLWFAMATIYAIHIILKHDTKHWYVVVGISACLIGILINAMACFPFQRALPPLLIMIHLAVLGFMYREYHKGKTHNVNELLYPGLAVVTFIGSIYFIQLQLDWIKCDRFYLRITSAEKAKMWEGVIKEANSAIALNPYRTKIMSYMGRAYIESGKSKEGIEALNKVINDYPYHMNAMLNLGVAYGNINDNENALKTYEKVVNIKPDYAKVHNNIANIYMKQNKFDEALSEFRLAALYDKTNPVIHFNVGIVALNKQLYEEARDSFKKAVELDPSWSMAHKNLGVVFYQFLGQKQEGIKEFVEALRLEPTIKDNEQMRKIIANTLLQSSMPQPQPNTPTQANVPQPQPNTPTQTDVPQPQANTPAQTDVPQPQANTPAQTDVPQPQANTPAQTDVPQPQANTPAQTDIKQ